MFSQQNSLKIELSKHKPFTFRKSFCKIFVSKHMSDITKKKVCLDYTKYTIISVLNFSNSIS